MPDPNDLDALEQALMSNPQPPQDAPPPANMQPPQQDISSIVQSMVPQNAPSLASQAPETTPSPSGGQYLPGLIQSLIPQSSPMIQGGSSSQYQPDPYAPPRPQIGGVPGLIMNLINPYRNVSAGQPAPSRLDHFENFVGNFLQSLSAGFQTPPGPGAGIRSAGAAMAAPYGNAVTNWQDRISGAKTQAEVESQKANTELARARTAQMGSSVTLQTPQGPMQVPFSLAKPYLDSLTKQSVADTRAGASRDVAHIKATSQQELFQFKELLNQGKVAFTKPIVDDEGKAVWGAYDKQGNLIKTLDRSIGPAWLQPTTRSGVKFITNQDGSMTYVPYTTTTSRTLPNVNRPNPNGSNIPMPPTSTPTPGMPTLSILGQGSSPAVQVVGGPQSQPNNNRPSVIPPPVSQSPTLRRGPVGAAQSVMTASGQPLQNTKATEQGYAFDPKSQEWTLASRSDAPQNGLQNWYPVKAQRIADDKSLNNQLADVSLKVGEYGTSRANPAITEDDRDKMRLVLRSDHFKLGAFGLSVPVDQLNRLLASDRIGDMSPAGKQALVDFYNARESLSGYNRVLTGSSRQSETQLKLNLDALPAPDYDGDFVSRGVKRFMENVHTVGQGLPRIPGVRTWRDVEQGRLPAGMNGGNGNSKPNGINFVPDK